MVAPTLPSLSERSRQTQMKAPATLTVDENADGPQNFVQDVYASLSESRFLIFLCHRQVMPPSRSNLATSVCQLQAMG
jgi:hypothetical protein